MSDIIERIQHVFAERGAEAYQGEAVSQLEHALQAAWLAEATGANATLICAALLHDVGHLLHQLGDDHTDQGIDDRHEELGARYLSRHFPPAVVEPIRLHVPAKRYLCSTEPGYRQTLSPTSQQSLELQGGAFTLAEAAAFGSLPFAEAAVNLRRHDDSAKVPDLATPSLAHFLPYLEATVVH